MRPYYLFNVVQLNIVRVQYIGYVIPPRSVLTKGIGSVDDCIYVSAKQKD
jgi:hypothetical protein